MCSGDKHYWKRVKQRAKELGADGCSGVPDFYLHACLEHDIHYRTHHTLDGVLLTRAEADAIFRKRIQQMSKLKRFSPMSYWRWVGVRIFGRRAWNKKLTTPPPMSL